MGFPYAGKYALKYRAYALYRGVRLSSKGCGAAHSEDEMFDFVRRGIDSDNPLALLILRHRAPELEDDNWHWVTVSGYLEGADGKQVILSNCGEREVRPASLLFERHPKKHGAAAVFSGGSMTREPLDFSGAVVFDEQGYLADFLAGPRRKKHRSRTLSFTG